MAATYDPSQPSAKDRVRRLIADVAAPFRFQDEEIAAELIRQGFSGNPLANSAPQEIPELKAAVALVESFPVQIASETTIKQGSVTRTTRGGAGDFSALLASLRTRLQALLAAELGGSGIAVVTPDYPETRRDQGWPGFGLPTP